MMSTRRSPFAASRLPPASCGPSVPLAASDKATFNRLALAGSDALVLFGATWCRPGQCAGENARHVAGRRRLAALTIDIAARRIGEVGEHDLEDWVALALG
jgi:hypothetical protein